MQRHNAWVVGSAAMMVGLAVFACAAPARAVPGPTLAWVGTTGYTSDGVDPDEGWNWTEPKAVTFQFRVKYTDWTGAEPQRARCVLQWKKCGRKWQAWKALSMTKESGDIATGAVYVCSTQLPNQVFKYRFSFLSDEGLTATGPPASLKMGPYVWGRPHLCWTGKPGYEADGVDPDSGPGATKFWFRVLYSSPANQVPWLKAQVEVKRNGALFKQKAMIPESGGSCFTGRIYKTSVVIGGPGTYTYRFVFSQGSGNATGPPAAWTAGPAITATTSLGLTSLAATPTAAGAQVALNLSAAANVTARVLNVAGRPVDTLIEGKPLGAGPQMLLWDRRSAAGLAVPSGLYLVKVTARAADGGERSGVATLLLR